MTSFFSMKKAAGLIAGCAIIESAYTNGDLDFVAQITRAVRYPSQIAFSILRG